MSSRTPSSNRLIIVAALGVASALALSACSGGSSGTQNSGEAPYTLTAATPKAIGDIDSFTWSLFAEPASLNFAYAFDYPPNQIVANVCESLLRWTPDLKIEPGLATSFANPTPTTRVYTIRQGVKFHDGTTMTAADVVASLDYQMNPDVGSYWASTFKNVASVEQTGADEVTVTTTVPDSQFNQYMAATPGVVESAATLEKDGADYGNPSTGINCTGPFSFESWVPGQSITLNRFDDYWDSTLKAKSGSVKFVFTADPNARVNAFKTGDVDGGWQVPSDGIDQLAKDPSAGKVYFGVNTAVSSEIVSNLSGPLGDVKVRQALLMATDRRGLIATGENGYARSSTALTTQNIWDSLGGTASKDAFTGLKDYPYDVKAAKALAASAGVDGQKVVIATTNSTTDQTIVAQAIAAAAQAIGLKPEIKTIPADQYGALFVDPAAREGVDLFYTIYYTSTSDPLDFFSALQTGNFANYGSFSDPDYDAAIDGATAALDPAERGEFEVKAQQIANEQLPWLPLFATPTTVWLGDRITGVAPSIDFLYYPWAATIGAAK